MRIDLEFWKDTTGLLKRLINVKFAGTCKFKNAICMKQKPE